MNTLQFLYETLKLRPYDLGDPLPIEIPNIGRDGLAILMGELGFTVGAEIGIERGLYSEVLCRENPGLRLYCIDSWKHYSGYRDHVSDGKLNRFYAETAIRLKPYNCELVKKFSIDAVEDFPDNALDFVYIDANHELPWVINDIIQWSRKVRPGGIVAGHDFRKSKRLDTRNHVVFAVQAYVQSYRIRPWFVLGTKEMKPGEVRDEARSWFWVKS